MDVWVEKPQKGKEICTDRFPFLFDILRLERYNKLREEKVSRCHNLKVLTPFPLTRKIVAYAGIKTYSQKKLINL